jgi:hypothetical protein
MSPQIMTSHRIEEVFMFDHVSIGVRNLARAKQFYDAALGPLGYTCLSEGADTLGYGRDKIALWIGEAAPGIARPWLKSPFLLRCADT